MTTRHDKKWTMVFACFAFVASASVQAAEPRMTSLSTTGMVSYIITTHPYVMTTKDIKDGLSKYFVQALKDDAAAYLATDGDIDGTTLESAWRTYLEQNADRQPSKKEFAHLVLATYG